MNAWQSWQQDMAVLFLIASLVAVAFIPWLILICGVLRPEVLS